MSSDVVTYIPLIIIALIAVFAAWAIRGKQVPDSVVGTAAGIAGVVFLILFMSAGSLAGLAFGLVLIGIGAFAWYRHLSKRSHQPDGQT
jgi:hypothetical protein